jgi:penicillin-binding protein 1B
MLRRIFLGVVAAIILVVCLAAVVAWRYYGVLDAIVVEKFNGRRWEFPSRVYSDSFLIYPGVDLKAAGFFDRLRRLNYREVSQGPLRKGDFRRTDSGLQIFLRDFVYLGETVRDRLVDLEMQGDVLTRLVDAASGEEIYSLQLQPEIITGLYQTEWEERRVVPLAEIPRRLIRAVLVTEDQRFYDHMGVDLVGMGRALVVDIESGRIVQGGSTLTQQLMKNFFLSEERTLRRKLLEAAMAIVAERRYSKNEILENYLNEIYLGQNGLQGIYGVWEASQFYFARSPGELSLAEAALLAGLIRAPNYYSPYKHPERAVERRNTVLRLLLNAGDVTAEEYASAAAEPLRTAPVHGGRNAAPYFVDFLKDELVQSYPPEVLTSEGLGIFTSLDLQMQKFAERAVREGLANLEKQYPKLKSDSAEQRVQACLVAIQPQTGEIKAMVGGRDYASSQFNRVVQGHRQPGSVFKPFVYLAAFEEARDSPDPVTPATEIEDEPFEWKYDAQTWSPANYHDRYLGEVRVRRALELSLNAATARLAHRIGIEPIRDLARRMGIRSDLPPYPSMVLGALEVSPFEIAQAYSVIADQGLRATARATKKVVDRDGHPIERNPVAVTRVVSPQAAYLVTHLMEGVLQRGTGQRARALGFTRPAAGKTGTTNESRDAWFAGFTPDLVAVVWVGFDQDRALGLTGAQAALPIWTRFMKDATAGYPPASFVPPAGVALVRIDPYTGALATPSCPQTIDEAFWKGQEPTAPCPLHGPLDDLPASPGRRDGAASSPYG